MNHDKPKQMTKEERRWLFHNDKPEYHRRMMRERYHYQGGAEYAKVYKGIRSEFYQQWYKEYRKEYRLKNVDKLQAKSRQYYEENKEKIMERSRIYYQRNREKRIACAKAYYQKIKAQNKLLIEGANLKQG